MSVNGLARDLDKVFKNLVGDLQNEIALKVVDESAAEAERVLMQQMRVFNIQPSSETGTREKQSKKQKARTRRYGSVTRIETRSKNTVDGAAAWTGSPRTAEFKVRFLNAGVNPHYNWGRLGRFLPEKPFVTKASEIIADRSPKIASKVVSKEISKIKPTKIKKTIDGS
jgi:hypothetical protein